MRQILPRLLASAFVFAVLPGAAAEMPAAPENIGVSKMVAPFPLIA